MLLSSFHLLLLGNAVFNPYSATHVVVGGSCWELMWDVHPVGYIPTSIAVYSIGKPEGACDL